MKTSSGGFQKTILGSVASHSSWVYRQTQTMEASAHTGMLTHFSFELYDEIIFSNCSFRGAHKVEACQNRRYQQHPRSVWRPPFFPAKSACRLSQENWGVHKQDTIPSKSEVHLESHFNIRILMTISLENKPGIHNVTRKFQPGAWNRLNRQRTI